MNAARSIVRNLLAVGLAAVEPGRAVRRAIGIEDGAIVVCGRPHPSPERVWLVAVGKAAGPMAAAASDRVPAIAGGVVVCTDGHHDRPGVPAVVEVLRAPHPVPGPRSLHAADRVLGCMREARAGDLVLAMISGGTSAMLAAPRPPNTLADLERLNRHLLASGAPIAVINRQRAAASLIKGGGLADAASPAAIEVLVVSDVPGDDPRLVGSGPFDRPPVPHHVVVRGQDALRAMEQALAEGDIQPLRSTAPAVGDVHEVARRYATWVAGAAPGACLLAHGEPTVILPPAHGTGGRNQHLALLMARHLDDLGVPAVFAALGTDGTDGPTTAAGGLVDTTTAARAVAAGHDLEQALLRCDSSPLLEAVGDALVTGPTHTNVMDLHVLLRLSQP